ncbi:hypothetical protein SKAU_G00031250 [Synaphobranchus kaupii]|uniref:Testicular haploid expressed protein n=1 Tax=Synaphobranchus kaupii TaxID=118154 RepID=A0A9Q1JFX0_SYNKA|nr:hypothetical protein SKAU_G00031250 [Synaphobranchus kaupii]
MVTGKAGCRSRVCPSARILQLAQYKDSKTKWVTTPCRKLTWGNQDSIWPLSYASLSAVPTERTVCLAKHKRRFSVWDEQPRKVQEGPWSTKGSCPTSGTVQYETLVRLSTPKYRSWSPLEVRPPHTERCERECPIWHFDVRAPACAPSPRLIQLACPKGAHPDFRGNRETVISDPAKSAHSTPRLDLLSVPKMRENSHLFFPLGYTEDPIRPVSKYARRAVASPRVKSLAIPKGVVKDYIPHRDPVWSPPRGLRTAGVSGRRDVPA